MSSASRRRDWLAVPAVLVLLAPVHAPRAAEQPDTLRVDLPALLDAARSEPSRFAADVVHAVDAARSGQWQVNADAATWHYVVRVPGAVSLSFHATRLELPADAVLTTSGGGVEHRITAAELRMPQYWSRIVPGDTLTVAAAMAPAARASFALQIAGIQVGFRTLGADTVAPPQHSQVQGGSAVSGLDLDAACVQNYACSVTAANRGPGRASVAVIVGNAQQCTGTLVNGVRGDDTPFVITGRHCHRDVPAGTDAAAAVTIYWNATTPCGQALSPVYSAATAAQTGAVTMAEQQDMWLIRLNDNPAVDDAWFAGFDAGGGAVLGGYTIHHAGTLAKQFAGWYGPAAYARRSATQLGEGYASEYWLTVNALGTVGPGASGGALFDQNDRLVGSLHLARNSTIAGDRCPAAVPTLPDADNGLAYFTQLARAWKSRQDTTSSTPTLQSVLDPDATGSLRTDGAAAKAFARLFVAARTATVGGGAQIYWNVNGALACVIEGGRAGDGWSGVLPAGGSLTVREQQDGDVTYGVACSYADGHTSRAYVTIAWRMPAPFVTVQADRSRAWTTRPVTLSWSANVGTCSVQGGTTSAGNLPAQGTLEVSEPVAGTYTYDVTCGSDARRATSLASIVFTPPAITFYALGAERRRNTGVDLRWMSAADACVASGGAPDETWSARRYGRSDSLNAWSGYARTTGTFVYRLTCSSGALTAVGEVSVVVNDAAPYVQLGADRSTVALGDAATITWQSNADYCTAAPAAVDAQRGDQSMSGSLVYRPSSAGIRTFTYSCFIAGQGTVTRTLDIDTPVAASVSPVSSGGATAAPAPATASAAGAGGGGAADLPSLAVLLTAALCAAAARHRRSGL